MSRAGTVSGSIILQVDYLVSSIYRSLEPDGIAMPVRQLSKPLQLLLQFESFQDTIRYYLYKYRENQVLALAYSAGCIVALVVIYRFLARSKKR